MHHQFYPEEVFNRTKRSGKSMAIWEALYHLRENGLRVLFISPELIIMERAYFEQFVGDVDG